MNPQVLGGLWWRREALARAAAAALAALLAFLLLLMLPLLVIGQLLGGGASGGAPAGSGIPAEFVPIYKEAAQAWRVNWYLLASVHQQETDFSRAPSTYTVNSSGCAGPMQIGVGGRCGCEWCAHKDAYQQGTRPADYPHPVSPHPSVYDSFDAIMAGAAILRSKVAGHPLDNLDEWAYRALCGYYGACSDGRVDYAHTVLDRAQAWQAASAGTEAPSSGGGAMVWPVSPHPVTSPFWEARSYERHPGVDLGAPEHSPIAAAAAGRVSTRGWVSGYGNFTCIDHTDAISSCYAHQWRAVVVSGELVRRGQLIGYTDCTGRCFGTHLHFEVRSAGRPVCPARFLGVPSATLCVAGSPGY